MSHIDDVFPEDNTNAYSPVDPDDYVSLEDTPGYQEARFQWGRMGVRDMYDECLRKMELNRILADQRWDEILQEVKRDIAWNRSHKAKSALKGNPKTIANERAKSDGIFKSRVGDYAFYKGRVDTYAKILMLVQNEKIIARLDAIVKNTESLTPHTK